MVALSNYLLLCFGTLIAVLSPLATVPPFLAMTQSSERSEQLRMAGRACAVACSVLIVFSLSGLTILNFFGITVPAFKIAGGIVLLLASLEMLRGGRPSRVTTEEAAEGAAKDDISITPLAVPLLCGPVTIVTGVLLSARAVTLLHYPVLVGTVLMIYAITYFVLRVAINYSHLFGEITMRVVSRLMGLLLAALAVQFIANGVRELDWSVITAQDDLVSQNGDHAMMESTLPPDRP